ncbi:MAG TPA: TonB-dependent receptor [Allosphingosinicella sp.]
MQSTLRQRLLASTLMIGAAVIATPAYAQPDETDPNAGQPAAPVQQSATESEDDTITVTGTLFRQRTTDETPSPVTVLSAESLQQRGINTVSEAVQRISANNAGTIQQGWNTGFNFASGANAPSLRGLTVQSTLSIFDGLRMAPYPLADDGQRNFVDLNTIPNAIIERIEILRDGASSTYGADAIAGVINIITRREIQGLHLNASAGISQRGDAGEQRIDLTYGYGDLDEQGFNFYVSGEYQRQDPLFARDRGYPFNSANLTGICGEAGSCMTNLNWNGVTPEIINNPAANPLTGFNGNISIPGVTQVRPVNVAGGITGNGRFVFLNPAAGCRGWTQIAVPASVIAAGTSAPDVTCEVDSQQAYIMLQPEIERMGITARATVDLGADHQLYAMGNYYRTDTFASFTPLGLNGTPTPPTTAPGAYNVILPVYVCPTGVGTRNGTNTGCTAANGVLNPQNPFAASGRTAQAFVRSTRGRNIETNSRALRAAVGLAGTIFDDWNYTLDFTASEVQLRRTEGNYFIPQRIMNLVARGQLNLMDLEANPQSTWDYIAPQNSRVSTSQLWQASATIARELFELPGGPLQLAVGAAYRQESIDAPSGNAAVDPINGNPYDRYYGINAVGTAGSRSVRAAFFELNAPILDQLEFNVSGRFDSYSTGQESFSPKVGVKFTPIPQLAIRGTWSRGFRIPSFNEAFGLPTTGYVTRTVNCATFAAFCAAHGGNAYATGQYSLGLTQTGNPGLDPERSTSFTLGAIFEPMRNVSFTVDFWRIKVRDLIVGVTDTSVAEAQYYSNNGVVTIPGITAVPGQPDPQFPNALPLLGFLESSFKNATSQVVQGLDFGANIRVPLTNSVTLISSFEASYLMKYHLTDENGTVLEYEGTLSPCNITSCSGAPQWRASWQNTLQFGDTSLTATAYYTSGYDTASIDFGGVEGDCQGNADIGSSTVHYVNGDPVLCRADPTWNVDLVASHRIDDRFTIYANILNVLDIEAPFEPSAAYHIFQFNPAWAGPNVMGRYFRVGARVDF